MRNFKKVKRGILYSILVISILTAANIVKYVNDDSPLVLIEKVTLIVGIVIFIALIACFIFIKNREKK